MARPTEKPAPDAAEALDGPLTDARPLAYQNVPAQPRVRPQWDPVELAQKYLDDMEKGGRLHHRNRREP